MTLQSLIFASYLRKPGRTVFTLLSVAVLFALFGILASVDYGFSHQVDSAPLERLYVTARYGGVLPIAYESQIGAVGSVSVVEPQARLSGYYQLRKNQIMIQMSDERYFHARPEVRMVEGSIGQLRQTRDGIIISTSLARKYGWRLGSRIPIISAVLPRSGSQFWTFTVVGVGENTSFPDLQWTVANYQGFDEARTSDKGTVVLFAVRISDPSKSASVSRAIDAKFANSASPTRTQSERELTTWALQTRGDVRFLTRSVGGSVFFVLLLLLGTTMMQAVRERYPEIGILKTVGFSDNHIFVLLFLEFAALCAFGATLGLLLVKANFAWLVHLAEKQPIALQLPWTLLLAGILFSVAIAFISTVLPAANARRLSIVRALAKR